jgi:hypothetical protein
VCDARNCRQNDPHRRGATAPHCQATWPSKATQASGCGGYGARRLSFDCAMTGRPVLSVVTVTLSSSSDQQRPVRDECVGAEAANSPSVRCRRWSTTAAASLGARPARRHVICAAAAVKATKSTQPPRRRWSKLDVVEDRVPALASPGPTTAQTGARGVVADPSRDRRELQIRTS